MAVRPPRLALVVAGLLITVGSTACRGPAAETGDRAESGSPVRAPAQASERASARAVRLLERALRTGDGVAAAALAVPGDGRTARQLRAAALNVSNLGLTDLRLRQLSTGAAAGAGSGAGWATTVEATWRGRRTDRSAARMGLPMTFAWSRGSVRIASLGEGADRMPLWLSGPVEVRRGSGWELVFRRSVDSSAAIGAALRRARVAVGRELGRVPTLVVELPGDAADYAAVLGSRPGEFAALAAVTTTADGSARPQAPLRVVLNPDLLAALGGVELATVLAHEAVHVAMRDVTSPGPRWLSEGFADYVALEAMRLRPATRAVARQAGTHRALRRLPDASAFTVSGWRLEAAYQASWLACRLIVERSGLEGLLRLRAAVRDGAPFARALREETGWRPAELERRWRQRLVALSR